MLHINVLQGIDSSSICWTHIACGVQQATSHNTRGNFVACNV